MKEHHLAFLLLVMVGSSVTQIVGNFDSPTNSRNVPQHIEVRPPSAPVDDPPPEEPKLESDMSSSTTPKADMRKSNFTEPRFAQLFNAKARRPRLPPVRHTTKAKPTLPPFIRSPPSLKVTTEDPPSTRSPSRAVRTSTSRTTSRTTTSAPRRNRNRESHHPVSTEAPKKNRRFGDSSFSNRNVTRSRTRN